MGRPDTENSSPTGASGGARPTVPEGNIPSREAETVSTSKTSSGQLKTSTGQSKSSTPTSTAGSNSSPATSSGNSLATCPDSLLRPMAGFQEALRCEIQEAVNCLISRVSPTGGMKRLEARRPGPESVLNPISLRWHPDEDYANEARADCWEQLGADERHRARRPWELVSHQGWCQAVLKTASVVGTGGIVALLGARGNGKTQATIEIARECSRQLLPCLYIRSREIGMALREAYDNIGLTEREAVERFVRPFLLIVDECQERPDKDWETRSHTLILDKRYGALRPTILIANSTKGQFVKLMGTSVADRIMEGGGAITFDWPSFRGQDKEVKSGKARKQKKRQGV